MGQQRYKLTDKHKLFILKQLAAFEGPATRIVTQLGDKDIAEDWGFEPISITRQSVEHYIDHHITEDQLADERKAFLNDYSDCPLAWKKKRVQALIREYEKIDSLKTRVTTKEGWHDVPASDMEKMDKRQSIIKQIKDEAGEHLDKVLEALRSSGHTFSVNIHDLSDDELEEITASTVQALKN